MGRKTDNLEILNRLSEYLAKNPDMRFGQALRNLGIVNDYKDGYDALVWKNIFYEEPSKTLERMDERKKEIV
jgi:hypothetical protein